MKKELAAMGVKGGASEVAAAMGVSRPYVYSEFEKNSPMFRAMVDYTVKVRRETTAAEVLAALGPKHVVSCEVVAHEALFTFFREGTPYYSTRLPLDGLVPTRGAARLHILLPKL